MALNSPRKLPKPEYCPVCDTDVPKNALACPQCGADHRSGWREDEEDDFDYREFVREEFEATGKPAGLKLIWRVTAALLILAFAWYLIRLFTPIISH